MPTTSINDTSHPEEHLDAFTSLRDLDHRVRRGLDRAHRRHVEPPGRDPAPGDTAEWLHDEHGELLRLCAYLAPSEFGGTRFAERVLITAEIAPGRPRPHPNGHAVTAPLHHAATAAAITHRELLTPQSAENPRSTWGNDTSPPSPRARASTTDPTRSSTS